MLSFSVDGIVTALGKGYYIFVYGIGVIAMLLSIIAFQFKHRVTIILSNFFGQTCWVLYFLLQGDLTSAIACALSAVMLAVFSKKDKWKWAASPFTIGLFIGLISGFSLLSFEGWSDIFPLLAGVFAVIANSRSDEKRLRQFSFFWCLFWLLNSVFKMYPVAFANDLLCTISTVVALIRYREKREKNVP
ncbi:MAG: YgjV family protein [Clostridia bacterium]|nr:YgjV family protein [Clostridia bacterium]